MNCTIPDSGAGYGEPVEKRLLTFCRTAFKERALVGRKNRAKIGSRFLDSRAYRGSPSCVSVDDRETVRSPPALSCRLDRGEGISIARQRNQTAPSSRIGPVAGLCRGTELPGRCPCRTFRRRRRRPGEDIRRKSEATRSWPAYAA